MDLPVLTDNAFLFVGNQAALDFVNTDLVLDGNPTDLLPSIEALISWSIQAGLVTKEEAKRIEQASGRHDAETLKQVKAFRTTMTDAVQFEHASILGPQNRGISDLDGVLERRW